MSQPARGALSSAKEAEGGFAVSFAVGAKRLGVSSRLLRRLVRSGRLLTVRVWGKRMLPVTELERLEARRDNY